MYDEMVYLFGPADSFPFFLSFLPSFFPSFLSLLSSFHSPATDSLLASPIILDLVILTELCTRITVKRHPSSSPSSSPASSSPASPSSSASENDCEDEGFEKLHPILSILSFLLKAPVVPQGSPVINALFAQRNCILNMLRACVGLAPENFMLLDQKLRSQKRAMNRR